MSDETKVAHIHMKVSEEEKERYSMAARRYRLSLSAFARLSMEYVIENEPTLPVNPADPVEPVKSPV